MTSLVSRYRDEGGSAAAEMVLVMPVAILLLLGATELGHYFFTEHQVVKGVRDGARFASRQNFADINCNGGSPSTVPTGVETAIQEVTRTGRVSGGTPRVSGWVNADVTVAVTCPSTAVTTGIYRGADNAPQINVSTTLSYPSLFGDVGFFNFSNLDLNATQQSAVMGI